MRTIQAPSIAVAADLDAAETRAFGNYAANLSALELIRPRLPLESLLLPEPISWVFARDGSLTAMLTDDRWWAGCSVPRRAAEFMFRAMDVGGVVGCFLSPSYAAQLRVVLDKLETHQAVLAIVPEEQTLAVLLHCEDFFADIAARRLWFVAGEHWESQLTAVLSENPGLPTASQFIRPLLASPEEADRLIAPAQTIFIETGARRVGQIHSMLAEWRPAKSVQRVCVIAPSRFRLWADSGDTLAQIDFGTALQAKRFDPDSPTTASPLALGLAARGCDAILAADVFRSNVPGVLPDNLPWITWLTTPNVPSASGAGRRDQLLLADPEWKSLAERAGWRKEQIHVARWPQMSSRMSPPATTVSLNVIADTHPLDVPESVAEYSSQRLLWEFIREELTCNPFALGADIDRYLASRQIRFQIGEDGFNSTIFIDRLIVPAYQQGLVRLLGREKLPVRVFGLGWEKIEEFAGIADGPIRSRAQLRRILDSSVALVHVWPWRHAHPVDSVCHPVVRGIGSRRETFVKDARAALRGECSTAKLTAAPALSSSLISSLLSSL